MHQYNIRGWLDHINDPNCILVSGDYFGMVLKYDGPVSTTNLNSAIQ